MSELEEIIKADLVVDKRANCPDCTIIAAKSAIGKIKVGQIVEILCCNEEAIFLIPRCVEKMGHEYLLTVDHERYSSIFIRRLK